VHKAQRYFDNCINPTGGAPLGLALNPQMANTLSLELVEDARSYLYSAVVSIGDAAQAVQREMFSWSTVKLYYALFYALRSVLAVHGYAILYHANGQKSSPYRLKAASGESPIKLSGNTHKVVLQQYAAAFPNASMVSQRIALDKPFDWMMNRREEVNYKNSRFCEPGAPPFFRQIVAVKLRQSIGAYIDDRGQNFAYDQDHAILALPIAAVQVAIAAFAAHVPQIRMADEEVRFLAGLFRDSHGEMPAAKRLLL
jgi:hypothetical protein